MTKKKSVLSKLFCCFQVIFETSMCFPRPGAAIQSTRSYVLHVHLFHLQGGLRNKLSSTALLSFWIIGTPHYSLTRFCLSFIVKQVATIAPSPRQKGDVSETTFIELTHTAIDFLAKSANILESAVDLNDSASVDTFLASAHSQAPVRALLHSF